MCPGTPGTRDKVHQSINETIFDGAHGLTVRSSVYICNSNIHTFPSRNLKVLLVLLPVLEWLLTWERRAGGHLPSLCCGAEPSIIDCYNNYYQ